MKKILVKMILPALLCGVIAITAHAQKLPKIQKTSLRAPANIKIDGNANEWGNKFQAYNKVTYVYYTLANDNDQLYLAVQATDPDVITKIVECGITFTVNSVGKKIDKGGVAITFPAYDETNKSLYLTMVNKPVPTKDTMKTRMQTDSFTNVLNAQLAGHLKIIEVDGAKTIADKAISIYNETGIKAASHIDNKIFYTYELAIPLKYLGFIPIVTGDKQSKFSYNIKLNGEIPKGAAMDNVGRPDIISYTDADGKSYQIGKATPQTMILSFTTDFWGEYTLAKK